MSRHVSAGGAYCVFFFLPPATPRSQRGRHAPSFSTSPHLTPPYPVPIRRSLPPVGYRDGDPDGHDDAHDLGHVDGDELAVRAPHSLTDGDADGDEHWHDDGVGVNDGVAVVVRV